MYIQFQIRNQYVWIKIKAAIDSERNERKKKKLLRFSFNFHSFNTFSFLYFDNQAKLFVIFNLFYYYISFYTPFEWMAEWMKEKKDFFTVEWRKKNENLFKTYSKRIFSLQTGRKKNREEGKKVFLKLHNEKKNCMWKSIKLKNI